MPINSSISAFFLLLSMFLGLNSCTKTKTFEVEYDNKLVVNSIIFNGTKVKVALNESKPPQGDIDFLPLTSAIVTLYGDTQSWILDSFVSPGVFKDVGYYTTKSNIDLPPNQNYKLKIITPNFPKIEAETFIPSVAIVSDSVITNVTFTPFASTNPNAGNLLEADLTFKLDDKIDKKEYYFVRISYISDYVLSKTFPFNLIDSINTKTVSFNISNIDDVRISFLLGKGLIFSDQEFNGQNKAITMKIRGGLELKNTQPDKATLEIWTLNEDYYKYITDVNKQLSLNTDPFAEPLNIYSNISGGLGIFGGYSVAKIILPLQ
jgi:Domain of unknown function (DUF4249)